MRTATQWFELYGESHQNPRNKTIHWLAIPVIVVVTLGLVQAIPHPFGGGAEAALNWASVAVGLSTAFYFRLSWTIGLGMLVIGASAVAINAAIAAAGLPLATVCITAFVLAWVAQFIGHKIEGKKPSFFQDLQFLLIGPAWLLQFVYQRAGVPVETWHHALRSEG